MTEDWMKRIQEENTHLKNQLRLLKENYELRAMLGHQCAGHCQGKAFRKTEPDVQQQPSVLEHFNYSPHVLSKENMALCTPSTHPQPKRFPTDPFLFQPRSGERKLSPLSSMSCAAVGGKQLEEFTDIAGLKKLWFTDSPLPGGDKPEALGPVSIAYYKAGRLLGSRDTPNSPSWSEERVSTSPLITSRKGSAHTTVSFSEELRIPEGASSPGTPARQASHLGGRALEPRTHHAQPVSEEMPRRKRVSFSEAPATDRQRKLHTFYLSELEIAQSYKKNGRIVGEIAFQLDRRILAHVFPGITRLYGFTVSNIPEKIKQICTKSLDGSLDEKKYRAMTQRYLDLTAHLEKMGYHTDIHPVFSEFLINTYGILKQRPDLCSDPIHNNPADLRKMVIDIVPSKFLGDTLLLLNCLCELSKEDNKALFAW